MAKSANLAQGLERLAGKLDKLGDFFAKPAGSLGEQLSQFKLSTRSQASLHGMFGAGATRAGIQGVRTLGSGITALSGAGFNMDNLDKGMKSSAVQAASGVGGAMSDIGGKLMTTGNPYAIAAGAVLKLGGVALQTVGKVKEWGDHLHEQNRMFSQFSASMAAVMAQDDARRILLEKEQGDRRSASARELSDARYRLDKSLAPIEDAFANLKNNVVAKLSDVVAGVIEKLAKLIPGLEGDSKAGQMEVDWNRSIRAMEDEIVQRRPARMRPKPKGQW